MKTLRSGDNALRIELDAHRWHEVSVLHVIFGDVIWLLYNGSYQQGFDGKRIEETKTLQIAKSSEHHPCVLCEDVFQVLESETLAEAPEDLMEQVQKVIRSVLQA